MGWTKRVALWGYQPLLGVAMAAAGPVFLARRGDHYRPTLKHRLGFGELPPSPGDRPLWIHAVSVGEVGVAATLAQALPETLPLLITTVTPTGQAQARKVFVNSGAVRQPATVAYLPFDLGYAVERFYRHFNPRGLVLTEGDYWPRVLDAAQRRQLPVAVVNARVGARAFSRQRPFAAICRSLFYEPVHLFAAQTEDDRDRLLGAGAAAERLHVAGNLKFDSTPPPGKPELEAQLTELAAGRPVLVAGSTMDGEETAVLDAFDGLDAGSALLILAPRHPERSADVLRLAQGRRRRSVLRSGLSSAAGSASDVSPPDIIVLDTLGELAALYRLASVAFIGGTLVPTGGHNPLEPAHFAKPIVVGPSMDNFRHMAQRFDEAGAWRRAADPKELAAVFAECLRRPQEAEAMGQRAAQLLRDNRGATQRTVELLRPVFGL